MAKNKDESTKILRRKSLPGEYSLYVAKYMTDHPKKMISKEAKKGWNPEFEGTYEVIIGMDKHDDGYSKGLRGFYHTNTHPKLSWYLETGHFTRLYEKINSAEEFHKINKKLGDCLTPSMNYKSTIKKIEDLLSKL